MEQHGAGNADPAVGADGEIHPVQRGAVVDAPAAGLAHAVRGDDPGAGRLGRREQLRRSGGAAEQDRPEDRQIRVEQAAELGRHQRDVIGAAGEHRLGGESVVHDRLGLAQQGSDEHLKAGDV